MMQKFKVQAPRKRKNVEEGMYENELVMVAVNFNGGERVIIYRKNGIEAKKSGNGNYLIK